MLVIGKGDVVLKTFDGEIRILGENVILDPSYGTFGITRVIGLVTGFHAHGARAVLPFADRAAINNLEAVGESFKGFSPNSTGGGHIQRREGLAVAQRLGVQLVKLVGKIKRREALAMVECSPCDITAC